VEYGNLYPIPGKSAATVGYDNDGYLAGQRVRLTKSTWLFDEITATYAHFGAVAAARRIEAGLLWTLLALRR